MLEESGGVGEARYFGWHVMTALKFSRYLMLFARESKCKPAVNRYRSRLK
jgi:hypothetical protein